MEFAKAQKTKLDFLSEVAALSAEEKQEIRPPDLLWSRAFHSGPAPRVQLTGEGSTQSTGAGAPGSSTCAHNVEAAVLIAASP